MTIKNWLFQVLNLHADCPHGCGSFRHSDSSLFLDSLNEPTSTDEFLSRSPVRRFSQTIEIWNQNYFDSIDHSAIVPDFGSSSDQFLIRRGEAMAECDSLERHSISSDNGSWILYSTLDSCTLYHYQQLFCF